jgi:hypothetical protein
MFKNVTVTDIKTKKTLKHKKHRWPLSVCLTLCWFRLGQDCIGAARHSLCDPCVCVGLEERSLW